MCSREISLFSSFAVRIKTAIIQLWLILGCFALLCFDLILGCFALLCFDLILGCFALILGCFALL